MLGLPWGSAWLFGSIRVFGAMALIRSRIGKFDVKTQQIKEAKVCWGLAFVATIAAIIGAPLLLSWFFDNPALTQIFQDGTDDLLGEAELFAAGEALVGSDSVEIDTDSVRIRTYGLVLGGGSNSFQSFFNEFETTAVPEPTTATVIVLPGVAVVARRRL